MAVKYYLNTAVHFYTKYSGILMIKSSDKGKYIPKETCIKYSA